MLHPPPSHHLLHAVVAAHRGGRVCSAERLQRTVYLLQLRGLPTGYVFRSRRPAPESHDLTADLRLLERWRMVTREEEALRSAATVTTQHSALAAIPSIEVVTVVVLTAAAALVALSRRTPEPPAPTLAKPRRDGEVWTTALGLMQALGFAVSPVEEPRRYSASA